MKRTLFHLLALAFLHSTLHAGGGETSSKDTTATQPCPSWYADREWNVSLWGTYAFTSNEYPTLDNASRGGVVPIGGATLPEHDRYLEADHAWGGGLDVKFFFARYFGVGIEGYVLDVRQSYPDVNIDFFDIGSGRNHARLAHDRRAVGSALGTFTFRYPIPCSRFAPYAFIGGGAIFGGGQQSTIINPPDAVVSIRSGTETKLVGQAGGGFEVRLTPHIGLINDFTWNVVDGRDNNFGMVRSGVNFAF